jgi:hypothetical protein
MQVSPDDNAAAPGSIPAAAPPRRTWRQQIATRWHSLNRHPPLVYWMLTLGLPLLVVSAVVFVVNGMLIGWATAYDVAVLIESPRKTTAPVAAWILSVLGWLLVPAVAGAVAGHIVSTSIAERRSRPIEEVFGEEDSAGNGHG